MGDNSIDSSDNKSSTLSGRLCVASSSPKARSSVSICLDFSFMPARDDSTDLKCCSLTFFLRIAISA